MQETYSETLRCYSSMGNLIGAKGLKNRSLRVLNAPIGVNPASKGPSIFLDQSESGREDRGASARRVVGVQPSTLT